MKKTNALSTVIIILVLSGFTFSVFATLGIGAPVHSYKITLPTPERTETIQIKARGPNTFTPITIEPNKEAHVSAKNFTFTLSTQSYWWVNSSDVQILFFNYNHNGGLKGLVGAATFHVYFHPNGSFTINQYYNPNDLF